MVTVFLWTPILHQAVSVILEKNSLGESISDRKIREFRKGEGKNENSKKIHIIQIWFKQSVQSVAV